MRLSVKEKGAKHSQSLEAWIRERILYHEKQLNYGSIPDNGIEARIERTSEMMGRLIQVLLMRGLVSEEQAFAIVLGDYSHEIKNYQIVED